MESVKEEKKESIVEEKEILTLIDRNLTKLYDNFFNVYDSYMTGKANFTDKDVIQKLGYFLKYVDNNIDYVVNNNYGFLYITKDLFNNPISYDIPERSKYKHNLRQAVKKVKTSGDFKTSLKPIATGSYGCIYRPPIKCGECKTIDGKDEKCDEKYSNKKYIMKYTKYKIDDPEYLISRKLEKVKDSEQYFTLLEKEICTKPDYPNYKLGKYCAPMKSLDKFVGYYSKYGGIPLINFLSEIRTVITGGQLVYILKHLLEGIKIMRDNSVTHFDLHSGNILVNSKINENKVTFTPTIIDFGLSSVDDSFENIKKVNEIDVHHSLPLFVNFYRSMFHYRNRSDAMIRFRELYTQYYKHVPLPPRRNPGLPGAEVSERLATYTDMKKYDVILGMWKEIELDKYVRNVIIPNLNKVDVYSLGLNLKRLLRAIEDSLKRRFSGEELKILEKMFEILNGMTDVEASLQYDVNKALSEVNKL